MTMPFLSDDFLLPSATGRRLYHAYACHQPIIDYHCHLDPASFAANQPFGDVAELWIGPDPYKWRAMRIAGIPHRVISGQAGPAEQFNAWAHTLEQLAGSSLFGWSHLEMKRFFGIDDVLRPDNAARIRDECNRCLQTPAFRPQGLLLQGRVSVFCTSDSWLDDLTPHRVASTPSGPRMLPSLRADRALSVDDADFPEWMDRLAGLGEPVHDLASYQAALSRRMDAFSEAGCRLADHALDEPITEVADPAEAEALFARVKRHERLAPEQSARLRGYLLVWLAGEYARRDWPMLWHLGANRRTSRTLLNRVGAFSGLAAIGAPYDVDALCRLLDTIERTTALPRTVLFPLNPADVAPIASLSGAFVESGVPGKVQLGPAWWYNDHRSGIQQHLDAVASLGVLGRFIGMTSDSRSFLSSVRHEYFRRVLCQMVGEWVDRGELPEDDAFLGRLIRGVCHDNAAEWLQPCKGQGNDG